MCDQSWVHKVLCLLILMNTAREAGAITKYLRSNEICSANNGKRIYLELGDRGVLKATNITTPILTNNVSQLRIAISILIYSEDESVSLSLHFYA